MNIEPDRFIKEARVPASLQPQRFGLWMIERRSLREAMEVGPAATIEDRRRAVVRGARHLRGFMDYTLLRRITMASIHLEHLGGEIVMEDSGTELAKHLPIWLAASGRVLNTGLGLGCVVRGLLFKPEVEHIDVVEIDPDICRIVGAEFEGNPRVTIHCADALTWDFGDRRWDFAWHDLHSFDERHLALMHFELISRLIRAVPGRRQGAWAFPREVAGMLPFRMLGAPR